VESANSIQLKNAVRALQNGELVAIPTETVYGLAADAKNPLALAKIFALKQRPSNHPLIVHIAGASHLHEWAIDIPDIAYALADQFWPGPLTLILRKHPSIPNAVTGGQESIGVRCPNHPVTLQLLEQFQGGLAAPSANRYGRISPTCAQHVREEFGAQAPFILEGGECEIGIESTIVDLSQNPPRLLRPGNISFEQLQTLLPDLQRGAEKNSPRVSGDKMAHYAPQSHMQMKTREEIETELHQEEVVLAIDSLPAGARGIALPCDATLYAHELYAALRELDSINAACIVLEKTPQTEAWLAVNDRLMRALAGAGI
jgi:L-threonylcarbamoyladenylate synthase